MSDQSKTPKTDEAKRLLERLHWDVKKVPFCRVLASLEQSEIESDARAERIAELEARLELLHDSLGSLAPAGTWLCDEVLRPIWQAKHRDVAITVAKIAQPLIAANGLWVGDREMASESAKLREALGELDKLKPDFTSPEVYYWAVKDIISQALAGKDGEQ